MPEASPRPSSDALPAKVSIAWGSSLLDVRHLPPGTHWELNDLRVEATAEGTRVMAGDEVLLAAGIGERVSKSLGGLEIDPVTGEQWLPTNIDGSYGQQVNLERALIWSKNPPALEVFKTMGKKDVASWARRRASGIDRCRR